MGLIRCVNDSPRPHDLRFFLVSRDVVQSTEAFPGFCYSSTVKKYKGIRGCFLVQRKQGIQVNAKGSHTTVVYMSTSNHQGPNKIPSYLIPGT